MDPCLIDSNIITEILKGNKEVLKKARQHIAHYNTLYLSIISYYEIMRGLKELEKKGTEARKRSRRFQGQFQEFCYENKVINLDELACRRAADLFAHLRSVSKSDFKDSGDLLVAGTALANGLTIVTHNRKDFEIMPGLAIEDWLEE